jgi:hypothetical protein
MAVATIAAIIAVAIVTAVAVIAAAVAAMPIVTAVAAIAMPLGNNRLGSLGIEIFPGEGKRGGEQGHSGQKHHRFHRKYSFSRSTRRMVLL